MSDLRAERRRYAEELRKTSSLRSAALVRALAVVPREDFLGPGPWEIAEIPGGYRRTPDADPAHVYRNVLVSIDRSRRLNNGQPSFLTFLIDALELEPGDRAVHVGCGTGYYTALIAEIVGSSGRVTAIEIDPELAERARTGLADRVQVEVVCADGFRHDPGETDAILVNAGATHPSPIWIERLTPGGRLVLPLTAIAPVHTSGGVVQILNRPSPLPGTSGEAPGAERSEDALSARFISPVGIFPCVGGRDPRAEELLSAAFEKGGQADVRSLRRDAHEPEEDCWLHGEGYCLSLRDAVEH
jgi:protein-L-isoaspartate(D-aspartate) O-methyltransferase